MTWQSIGDAANRVVEKANAYRILRKELIEQHGLTDDDQVLLDTLDGENDIMDQLAAMLRRGRELETWIAANRLSIDALKARNDSLAQKVERLRKIAMYFLGLIGRKRIEAPDFTYTLANGRQTLMGECDPDKLPDKYVRIKREPNRLAIFAALKDGEVIEGYTISNGSPHLRSIT